MRTDRSVLKLWNEVNVARAFPAFPAEACGEADFNGTRGSVGLVNLFLLRFQFGLQLLEFSRELLLQRLDFFELARRRGGGNFTFQGDLPFGDLRLVL